MTVGPASVVGAGLFCGRRARIVLSSILGSVVRRLRMENSHIQWTDHTQNFWIGCTKVSPGCAHCYAEARDKRFADGIHWGKGAPRQRTGVSNWHEPVKWNRVALDAACGDCDPCLAGHPEQCALGINHPKIFCSSLSDILDAEVPIEWFAEAMGVVMQCSALTWQLLTKRPELFRERVASAINYLSTKPATKEVFALIDWLQGWQSGNRIPGNVWIGTSVENQACADSRIPALLKIPAKIRFLSCEPLLADVDLRDVPNSEFGEGEPHYDSLLGRSYDSFGDGTNGSGVHWVIVGGESGSGARPMVLDWVRHLVAQCNDTDIPIFVKQLGREPIETMETAKVGDDVIPACEMPVLLNDKKGGDMQEWPTELRVREFPK